MQQRALIFSLLGIQTILIVFLLFKVMGTSDEQNLDAETLSSTAVEEDSTASTALRVAYINNDTLIAGYAYQQELRESLENQARLLDADLQKRTKVFEENYTLLEQEAPNMSPEELQYAQADLMQRQQELIQYRDARAQELAEEEARLTNELLDDLNAVLKELKKEQGIDFIFSLSPTSSLLMANDRYDMTQQVVSRLNENYAARKE
jgi:outer membrane protein